MFFQGDACTSCSSLSAVVGDGVAVTGPKGERGYPGPPGEGKPGRNVRKPCVCSLIYLLLCTVRITDACALHVFFSGKTRLTRCAGTCRSQRKPGVNVHLFNLFSCL